MTLWTSRIFSSFGLLSVILSTITALSLTPAAVHRPDGDTGGAQFVDIARWPWASIQVSSVEMYDCFVRWRTKRIVAEREKVARRKGLDLQDPDYTLLDAMEPSTGPSSISLPPLKFDKDVACVSEKRKATYIIAPRPPQLTLCVAGFWHIAEIFIGSTRKKGSVTIPSLVRLHKRLGNVRKTVNRSTSALFATPNVAPQAGSISDGASFLHLTLGPLQTIDVATRDDPIVQFNLFNDKGAFVKDYCVHLSQMHELHSAFSSKCWCDFLSSLVTSTSTTVVFCCFFAD